MRKNICVRRVGLRSSQVNFPFAMQQSLGKVATASPFHEPHPHLSLSRLRLPPRAPHGTNQRDFCWAGLGGLSLARSSAFSSMTRKAHSGICSCAGRSASSVWALSGSGNSPPGFALGAPAGYFAFLEIPVQHWSKATAFRWARALFDSRGGLLSPPCLPGSSG